MGIVFLCKHAWMYMIVQYYEVSFNACGNWSWEQRNVHWIIWLIKEMSGLKSNSIQIAKTQKENKSKVSMILIFQNNIYKG